MHTYLILFWEEQTKEIFCICCKGCVGEIMVHEYYMREQTD